jgi:hypothetical protein
MIFYRANRRTRALRLVPYHQGVGRPKKNWSLTVSPMKENLQEPNSFQVLLYLQPLVVQFAYKSVELPFVPYQSPQSE